MSITPNTKVHIWDFNDTTVPVRLMTLAVWKVKIALEIKLGDFNGDAIRAAMKHLSCPDDYEREFLLEHITTSYNSVMAQYEGTEEMLLKEAGVTERVV